MAIQRTLVLVKPDGVKKALITLIRQRYIDAGLVVVKEEPYLFRHTKASDFYREHEDGPHYEGLVLAMTSGHCQVMVLEGEDAIALVRRLNGATKQEDAEPGTIRHDYKSAGGPFNIVHGSDSPEAFERESAIIFR